MKKKLLKGLGIIGGLFVISEVFGIVGEAQAFAAMESKYPDEVEDMLDVLDDDDTYAGVKNPYTKFKAKTVSSFARSLIESIH